MATHLADASSRGVDILPSCPAAPRTSILLSSRPFSFAGCAFPPESGRRHNLRQPSGPSFSINDTANMSLEERQGNLRFTPFNLPAFHHDAVRQHTFYTMPSSYPARSNSNNFSSRECYTPSHSLPSNVYDDGIYLEDILLEHFNNDVESTHSDCSLSFEADNWHAGWSEPDVIIGESAQLANAKKDDVSTLVVSNTVCTDSNTIQNISQSKKSNCIVANDRPSVYISPEGYEWNLFVEWIREQCRVDTLFFPLHSAKELELPAASYPRTTITVVEILSQSAVFKSLPLSLSVAEISGSVAGTHRLSVILSFLHCGLCCCRVYCLEKSSTPEAATGSPVVSWPNVNFSTTAYMRQHDDQFRGGYSTFIDASLPLPLVAPFFEQWRPHSTDLSQSSLLLERDLQFAASDISSLPLSLSFVASAPSTENAPFTTHSTPRVGVPSTPSLCCVWEQRPTIVKELFEARLKKYSDGVLQKLASVMETGSLQSRSNSTSIDSGSVGRRSASLLLAQWKAELLSLSVLEAAADHLGVLELRRLGEVVAHFCDSMKRRPSSNSR